MADREKPFNIEMADCEKGFNIVMADRENCYRCSTAHLPTSLITEGYLMESYLIKSLKTELLRLAGGCRLKSVYLHHL